MALPRHSEVAAIPTVRRRRIHRLAKPPNRCFERVPLGRR